MGLLQKIKSVLGLDGSSGTGSPRADPGAASAGDVDVTVEHEPATGSENAVKGTDADGTGTASSEPAAATATTTESAGTSTGAGSDAPAAESEVEAATGETPEGDAASGDRSDGELDAEIPEAESSEPDEPAAAGTDDPDEAADESSEAATPEDADEPVDTIKGIGSAYAERLAAVGIETVGDLAAAEAASVAEETDISETRLERWIERARS